MVETLVIDYGQNWDFEFGNLTFWIPENCVIDPYKHFQGNYGCRMLWSRPHTGPQVNATLSRVLHLPVGIVQGFSLRQSYISNFRISPGEFQLFIDHGDGNFVFYQATPGQEIDENAPGEDDTVNRVQALWRDMSGIITTVGPTQRILLQSNFELPRPDTQQSVWVDNFTFAKAQRNIWTPDLVVPADYEA